MLTPSVSHALLPSPDKILDFLRTLRRQNLHALACFIGENYVDFFPTSHAFLDELGLNYYYAGFYDASRLCYQRLIALPVHGVDCDYYEGYCFNAHFTIPSREDLNAVNAVDLPINPLVPHPAGLITITMTTCKRLDLFKRTVASMLACIEDLFLVSEWIVMDDGSTPEDLDAMRKVLEPIPYAQIISSTHKGHAHSMNELQELVKTPYVFHVEDDWEWVWRLPYLTRCLDVLSADESTGQVLLNRNYAEIADGIAILGGESRFTSSGVPYRIHEFEPDADAFASRYGSGQNCAYWPHYSLRVGLMRRDVWDTLGPYKTDGGHFEMDYAYRYAQAGFQTVFLDNIHCIHIGRLTSERHDPSIPNAYALNDEAQFGIPPPTPPPLPAVVVNLDRRPDRLMTTSILLNERGIAFERFPAVDGSAIKATTSRLFDLFVDNDYNFRRAMIGCALSHLQIWADIVERNETHRVVFEDDLTAINSTLSDFLNAIQTQTIPVKTSKRRKSYPTQTPYERNVKQTEQVIMNSFDVLFLGHHSRTPSMPCDLREINIHRVNVIQAMELSLGGTFAYIITRRGAERLLAFIQRFGMLHGIDTMMQIAADEVKVCYTEPQLVHSVCLTAGGDETVDTDIQRCYESLLPLRGLAIDDEGNRLKRRDGAWDVRGMWG
jgi:GR25 family glycosyltransferase involved in LPS biosynthesis